MDAGPEICSFELLLDLDNHFLTCPPFRSFPSRETTPPETFRIFTICNALIGLQQYCRTEIGHFHPFASRHICCPQRNRDIGSRLPTPCSEDAILRKMLIGRHDAHGYDHVNGPARLLERPITTAIDMTESCSTYWRECRDGCPGPRSRNIDGGRVPVKASFRCGETDRDVVQIRVRQANLGNFQGLPGKVGGGDYTGSRDSASALAHIGTMV